MTRQLLAAALAALTCGLTAGASAGDRRSLNAELAAVRASTAEFHDLSIAQGAGWNFLSSGCVVSPVPGGGAMGFHYVNPSLTADTGVDPLYPEVLVYEPTADGGRQLVAVEWLVFRHLQPTPPTLFGHTFHLNSHLGPQGAWILHAWLWRHNPDGMFQDFNTRVSCDDA